jgi:hypothetical protein
MGEDKMNGLRGIAIVGICAMGAFATPPAGATVVQCGGADTCSQSFSITLDQSGEELGGGQLIYDAETGAIALDTSNVRGGGMVNAGGGLTWMLGDGSTVDVGSLGGNADPILSFGVSAHTGAAGHTFSFAFDLPIALSGPLAASSKVSYSLTSETVAGAQVTPLLGNTVTAREVDTSVGGIGNLNKGVDVGATFFFFGIDTQNSPVYTASSTLVGNTAYDLMSVLIAFSLSPNASVGMSGFVQQVAAVPLPAALPLLLSGLAGLGWISRRRRAAA